MHYSIAGDVELLLSWSVGMECFARLLAQFWCWQRQIQTTFENIYVGFVLAHTASALEVLQLCGV